MVKWMDDLILNRFEFNCLVFSYYLNELGVTSIKRNTLKDGRIGEKARICEK